MNLMIVEDSELVRNQILRAISNEPRIRVVCLCEEEDLAVKEIRRLNPDFVILDLSLSPGSGLNVLRRIRCFKVESKVLVVTNNTDSAIERECRSFGISGFFDKSNQFDECLQILFGSLRHE
ncbi:response regulator transcription factor [Undibacterium sp. LX40W]|uniref:Response regulator transcription factor n=2 Tax=Undibacterium TaxID=401469 RepID=A0A923KSE9_9BURK|nr:response regulator transcription factor [Undibacterium nitidum]MBC3891032.1 response regulator transcription factor [Undibacterium sp. LX40W]